MHKSFDLYIEYLEKNKHRFPPPVFSFAADIERHNLDSPHSLHDAWVESLTVREIRKPQRPFDTRLAIKLVMLGPMHDREIILSYDGVAAYRVEGVTEGGEETFHGDVNRHEIRVTERGFFVHEIEFFSGSRVLIEFDEFRCVERLHCAGS